MSWQQIDTLLYRPIRPEYMWVALTDEHFSPEVALREKHTTRRAAQELNPRAQETDTLALTKYGWCAYGLDGSWAGFAPRPENAVASLLNLRYLRNSYEKTGKAPLKVRALKWFLGR